MNSITVQLSPGHVHRVLVVAFSSNALLCCKRSSAPQTFNLPLPSPPQTTTFPNPLSLPLSMSPQTPAFSQHSATRPGANRQSEQ
ncbi:hypothetical protein RRG08_060061 [Elysia crispata]|uniref:Uncharacterized protein n=1 Tax=Elysia crispata TaxID=231223 RepID=A0AAE0Y091_9GAST|nr:hypothetical protein RRG08_060061 [Elysia crispata]